MNKETKQSKLDKLKVAMKDAHFLNDLNEVSENFKAVDVADGDRIISRFKGIYS